MQPRYPSKPPSGITLPLAALLLAVAGPASAATPESPPALRTIAIADFDYEDTSGEPGDRTAEHAARLTVMTDTLRSILTDKGAFRVVSLTCDTPPCSAGSMPPGALITAAREAGGQLLIYGGIHKVSTLVQFGKVHMIDLEADRLTLDRNITFRDDSDASFRHAAIYIADYVVEAGEKATAD